MKKFIAVIILVIWGVVQAIAQGRLAGRYDYHRHTFIPADGNILVKYFGGNALVPFMIKGKDPFDPQNNHTGYIDTLGNIIISPVYNNCSGFKDDYALVMQVTNGKYTFGVIDKQGRTVFPVEYQNITKCQNGLLMLFKDGKIGFASPAGKVIVPLDRYSRFATPPPVYMEGDDTPRNDFYWNELTFGKEVKFKDYIGVEAGTKWAVIDSTGREIIPPSFDGMGIFNNKMAPAKLGGKWGIIDITGKLIIPAMYDNITLTGMDFVYVGNKGKSGVISFSNKVIVPLEYANVGSFGNGFIAYDKDNKAVLCDAGGKVISQAVYSPFVNFPVWGNGDVGFFVYRAADKKFHPYQDVVERRRERYGKRQLFFKRNNKWGLMDSIGRETTPPLFDLLDDDKLYFLAGNPAKLIGVMQNGKWGVINSDGHTLLPCIYDNLKPDQNKLIVQKGTKFGVFTKDLAKLSPVKYDSIAITHDDGIYNDNSDSSYFVSVRLNKKWALLNFAGKEVTPFQYDSYLWLYHKLAPVKINGKWGVINAGGKQVARCVYDEVILGTNYENMYFFDGRFIVKQNGQYGLIDLHGTELLRPEYSKIVQLQSNFSGRYQISQQGKVGMFDCTARKVVIPCLYDEIRFYPVDGADNPVYYEHAHYLITKKNGRYGLLDSVGSVRLPFKYDNIFRVSREGYYVVLNNKQGVFNNDLKLIIPPEFNYIGLYYKDIYIVHGDYGMGLINKSGDVIAGPLYQHYDFCGDNIIVKKGDKFGVMDFKGKIITPFVYNEIVCRNDKIVETK